MYRQNGGWEYRLQEDPITDPERNCDEDKKNKKHKLIKLPPFTSQIPLSVRVSFAEGKERGERERELARWSNGQFEEVICKVG